MEDFVDRPTETLDTVASKLTSAEDGSAAFTEAAMHASEVGWKQKSFDAPSSARIDNRYDSLSRFARVVVEAVTWQGNRHHRYM